MRAHRVQMHTLEKVIINKTRMRQTSAKQR